jgi:hypothetical protein
MADEDKPLFVGIKISKALQNDLDSPAPGTKTRLQSSTRNRVVSGVPRG